MKGIKYIDYYIPPEQLSIERFVECIDDDAVPGGFSGKEEYQEFINEILRLKNIRVEKKLSEIEMLDLLLADLFAKENLLPPSEIDIILVAESESSFPRTKNLGQYLQHRHKMDNAYVMNLSGNYCANIDFAVSTAHRLLTGDRTIRNILVVSVCKIKDLSKRIVGSYALLSDAAGIMLLSQEDAMVTEVNNNMISNGLLYDSSLNEDNSLLHCKYYIKCLVDLLNKNGLTNRDIGCIIIQNANMLMISQCIASIGLDTGKIFHNNLGRYGHMDCLDYLVNLKDAIEGNHHKNGRILTFGTGIAGNYIASVLEVSGMRYEV